MSSPEGNQEPLTSEEEPEVESSEAMPDGDTPEAQTSETDASLETQLAEAKDKWIRQVAEFQNFKRRTAQERLRWGKDGEIRVISEMIDVLDDLRRSVEASQDAAASSDPETQLKTLTEGVDLVYASLESKLQKFGVEAIEAVGQSFDESVHEALMQQPAPEGVEDGAIINEVQRGYRMGDRVLKHAKVIVAKADHSTEEDG